MYTKAKLILEATVVPEGPNLDILPLAHSEIIKYTPCRSFFLWQAPVAWYGPRKATGLMTTPGIILPDRDNSSLPTNPVIRFHVQWAIEQSRRGGFIPEKEWGEYWENPYRVLPESQVPFFNGDSRRKEPYFQPYD